MINSENQKQQQIESLNENLHIIDYCLKFDKSNESVWAGQSKSGCLGIPAAILICSLIDTIGSVFSNSNTEITIDGKNHKIENASDHFYILNHTSFFNLNLHLNTINDFYSTYRCKLTHNNLLPANNFISIGKESDVIFKFDDDYKIIKINLKPLYEITKTSSEALIYYLKNGTFSPSHKLTQDLEKYVKPFDSSLILSSSDTGHTKTVINLPMK